ncbi:MAG: radical SAM protein [Theionarchaea archaeon]|nr:radical SAM protein [Theionarchaea archaeon]MBU7019795.1 radical SAM protein [Theionarchaea archaeon]MBU7035575.1 radical SAM protein [Theionarchaea archaeon]
MHFLEYGVIRKRGEHRVALVYPNLYKAGNSNLGFLFAYNFINEQEGFQCERFFTDFPKSIESNSVLEDFDIIAFSCSFEMDYFTVYEIAQQFPETMKIMGGRTTYNPFPLKGVIDYIFVGDAEHSLAEFLNQYREGEISQIEGVFTGDAARVQAGFSQLEYHPVHQPIQWGEYGQAFYRSFLLEVSRGCSRQCAFCMVSHCIGMKRERPLDQIQVILEKAERCTKFEVVSLIGPDSHSRLLEIMEMCRPYRVSLPSLRIDQISEEVLTSADLRTVTIAPESSERLRISLGKRITDEEILEKVRLCSEHAHWMKLYFMVGLPGETLQDLEGIVDLTRQISRIMRTKVTVSPFVPKPHTPYADHVYDTKTVEKALSFLKNRMRFSGPTARKGFIQWAMSMGDEQVIAFMGNRRYSAWRHLDPARMEKKWKLIKV